MCSALRIYRCECTVDPFLQNASICTQIKTIAPLRCARYEAVTRQERIEATITINSMYLMEFIEASEGQRVFLSVIDALFISN